MSSRHNAPYSILCGVQLSRAQLCLAVSDRFVLSHPLVASAVVGATSTQQLTELLDIADEPPLPDGAMDAIDAIHQLYPNPCP